MSLSFSEARIFLSRDSNSFLKDQVRSTQDIENNKRRSKRLPTHEGRPKISVMRGWFNLSRWWELEVSMEPHHSKMIYYLKRRETSVKKFWSLNKEQIYHCLLLWCLRPSCWVSLAKIISTIPQPNAWKNTRSTLRATSSTLMRIAAHLTMFEDLRLKMLTPTLSMKRTKMVMEWANLSQICIGQEPRSQHGYAL